MFVIALRHLLPFHPLRRSREREEEDDHYNCHEQCMDTSIYTYVNIADDCQMFERGGDRKNTTRCSMHERKNVSAIRALSTVPNRSKTRSIENGESRNRVGHFSLSRCNVTLQLISYGSPAMIVHAQLHFIHLNLNEEWGGRSTSLIGNNTHKATRQIVGTCYTTKPTLSS